MANLPKVCIVVPLYNETRAVPELIRSLSGLKGDFDAVLVDASDNENAKTALGLAVASFREPAGIRIVHSDVRGRAVQMNMGAASSDGELILFLHCDTRLPPDAVELIRDAVNNGRQWGRFDVDLESEGVIYRIMEFMLRIRSRVRRLATGDQAMFVSRTLFDGVGGFPDIPLMEDIAVCKLLNESGPPALVTTAVVTSGRRWENAGVLKTILLMWKLRFLYWVGMDPAKLAAMYSDER